jgi:hypothetical protein
MKSAKLYVFRSLSLAQPAETSIGQNPASRRPAGVPGTFLVRPAMKATDSPTLQNLEEELKQTSAAHNFVCYAVEAHLSNQHTQTRGDRLAA